MAASPSKAGPEAQGSGVITTPPLKYLNHGAFVEMFFHCYSSTFDMAQDNSILKERVRAFWQQNPCGTKFADASPGSRRFYELVEEHRYKKEWHIPTAADFAN